MIKKYPVLKKLTHLIFFFFTVASFSQIQQRGTAKSNTSPNSSLTIDKPVGIAVGDIMLVNIAQGTDKDRDKNPLNIDPTSLGWTLISSEYLDGREDRKGSVLYKIAVAADVTATNYTFALDADNDSAVGAIIAFSGVDTTTVPSGTINTDDSSTVTATTITTVTANAAIVMLGQAVGEDRKWSGWSTTSPGTLSELFDAQNGSGKKSTIGGAWAIKPTVGVTGNGTATLSNDERNGGVLLALRPYIDPNTSTNTFTSSGTFTVPSCVTSLTIQAWGGGASGGAKNKDARGGGGGGGYVTNTYTVIAGQTIAIVVGTGGIITVADCDCHVAGSASSYNWNDSGDVIAGGGQADDKADNGTSGGTISGSYDSGKNGGNGAKRVDGKDKEGGGGGGSGPGASNANRQSGGNPGGGDGGNKKSAGNNGTAPGGGGGGKGGEISEENQSGNGANGQVIITYTVGGPTNYSVTGGGSYCAGGAGVAVGLANSESGVTYQLYRGAITVGSAVSGTGAAISFGNQTVAGTYTIKATNGGCTADMTGSAVITINPAISAPTVGTITQPTCTVGTGSVILNGLPSGSWQLTRSPGSVVTTGTGTSTTISGLATGTYTYSVIGANNGTGLKADYFNNMTLSGTPALTRTDATVNFNWGNGNPGAPIGNDNFSVRWSGLVQPLYSENYTFSTNSDDGIRLWVNGIQIINNWTNHGPTINTGTIALTAGIKYDIVLEFYENGGGAVSELSWSSSSQVNQIIPQTQLYPNNAFCSSPASADVVIKSQPLAPVSPGAITGIVTQFPTLTEQIYSIAAVPNATTYNWTVPIGWSITAGAGTTNITVTTGNVAENGIITVSAQNACGISGLSTLAVTVIPSKIDFDGTDDYIDFGDNHDLTGNFTLEAWVLQESTTATGTIISKRDALSTNKRGYHLSLNNGKPNLTWYDNSGAIIVNIISPKLISNNIWHHIAASYDGTTAILYADGILVTSDIKATPPTNGTEKFLVGAMYDSSTPTTPKNNFNGYIDEVRVWDVALTAQQIREMMNQRIIQNGTAVKGRTIPLDITEGLLWSNLKGYYPMSDGYTANDQSGNAIKINGSPKNITTNQPNTAPLPYESIAGGDWDVPTTWKNNTVQYLPNSIGIDVSSTPIDWNIVETTHNINTSRNIKLLGLKNNANELSINADYSIEISNYLLLNGVIDLDGESQLIQSIGSILDNSSTGFIERDQQGEGNKYRYNYWSMPVYTNTDAITGRYTTIGASLRDGTNPSIPASIKYNNSGYDGATSPFTLSTFWMYKYANSGSGYSAWNQIRSTGNLYSGQGFTMKGPGVPGSPEQNYVFVGKPNNGTIELTVATDYDYLVGNPYPSAIDADQFILDNKNSITGAIYFWEHYGGNTHNLAGYQGGYATYNLSSNVGVPASAFPGLSGGTSAKGAPKRYIPVGQAFFVVGDADGGQIQFNNGQRKFIKESSGNSIFMKTNSTKSQTANNTEDDLRPKFRIGFDAPKISHRQLLLTVDERATKLVDWGFDAEIYEIFADDMYWMLNNKKYVIQGTNAIGLNSEVPLGIQLSKTGVVTVKIDALENVDDDTSIYLKDKLTCESFNMRDKPVQLNLTAGKYADRFVIVFNTQKLVVEDIKAETLIPSIAQPIIEGFNVFMNNAIKELQIKNNSNEEILNIALINSLGQTIKIWNSNFNNKTISLPINVVTGVYLVQINTKKGATNKKIVVN